MKHLKHSWHKKYICTALGLAANAMALAQSTGVPPQTTITSVVAYPAYGTGDFVFRVANPIPECDGGYWIAPSDPGYKVIVATALMLYQSKTPVYVFGIPSQLWAGSSSRFCKLYAFDAR
jgi:hypothetical protein